MLIDLCKSLDLIIVNGRIGKDKEIGEFTFESTLGSSTIDYAIISSNLFPYISNFKVDILDQSLSDFHCPIILTINNLPIESKHAVDEESHVSDIIYKPINSKWDMNRINEYQLNLDSDKFRNYVDMLGKLVSETPNQQRVDEVVNALCNLYVEPALKMGISKLYNTNYNNNFKPHKRKMNKPWFDKECIEKRKKYFRVKNKLRKSKSYRDRLILKNENKLYKKLIRFKLSKYCKDIHNKLRLLKSKNPKEYWNILSSSKNKNSDSIHINKFYEHFKELNDQNTSNVNNFNANDIMSDNNNEINFDFTLEELDFLINKLKNNKASGFDNVINEFIKYSSRELRKTLVVLFNIILNSGIVPTAWCISLIKPLYKNKGPRDDVNNYRGISLISCIGKLFTALINQRLEEYINKNQILGEEQAGFRSNYSTMDHIFVLNSIIDLYLNKIKGKKRLFCAFIDYEKAFDLVDRVSLWSKLLNYKVNGKLMRVIYNIYENAKACVKLNNVISYSFPCKIGVRQGDNISPLLFSLFINDFRDFIATKYCGLTSLTSLSQNYIDSELEFYIKLYILLYADDTVIFAENAKELQLALDALSDYCSIWNLKINIDKTKIIRFSKRRSKKLNVFKLNGEVIEIVDNYVYLGTTIRFNGKFHDAQKKQILQAKKALFAVISKKVNLQLPLDIYLNLFDTIVSPVLLYGSEIWGYENIDNLEIFFRSFLKKKH